MPVNANWQCEHCDYDLSGLPAQGRCPECGKAYDTVAHVGVYGENPAQRRLERALRRVRTILFFVAALCVMGCGGLLSLFAVTPARPLIIGAIFAGVCVLGGVTSYMYEKGD